MDQNLDYYARRAEEERVAAGKALHPVVRERHLEMARAYEQRVRTLGAEQARLTIHLVSAA